MLLPTLLGLVVASLGAFAALHWNPHWVQGSSGASSLRDRVFSLSAQGFTYASAALLAIFLCRRWRWNWLTAFALVFGIGMAVEYCGARFGVPFGEYRYSDMLGFKFAAEVPVVVPLAWFIMGIASFGLSTRLTHGIRWARHPTTALLLVCWDLALDPAMSQVNTYWQWECDGVYYATPLENFLGWFGTGLAISFVLERTLPSRITARESRWLAGYYLINGLMPLGIMLVDGLLFGALLAISVLLVLILGMKIVRSAAV